jgi:hypothetical protein
MGVEEVGVVLQLFSFLLKEEEVAVLAFLLHFSF